MLDRVRVKISQQKELTVKRLIIAVLVLTLANGVGSCRQGSNDKETLAHVQGVGEVNMRMSNGQSVTIATTDYVRLVDGDISQVGTNSNYQIKRRVIGDILYLDVYQNGSYVGSRKHNQPVKRHGVQTL